MHTKRLTISLLCLFLWVTQVQAVDWTDSIVNPADFSSRANPTSVYIGTLTFTSDGNLEDSIGNVINTAQSLDGSNFNDGVPRWVLNFEQLEFSGVMFNFEPVTQPILFVTLGDLTLTNSTFNAGGNGSAAGPGGATGGVGGMGEGILVPAFVGSPGDAGSISAGGQGANGESVVTLPPLVTGEGAVGGPGGAASDTFGGGAGGGGGGGGGAEQGVEEVTPGGNGADGGGGGGALQFVAGGTLTLDNSTINVEGGDGDNDALALAGEGGASGGGGGGTILLQAPDVVFNSSDVSLEANGGQGGSGMFTNGNGGDGGAITILYRDSVSSGLSAIAEVAGGSSNATPGSDGSFQSIQSSQVIPEPGSASLLLGAAALWLCRRRQLKAA